MLKTTGALIILIGAMGLGCMPIYRMKQRMRYTDAYRKLFTVMKYTLQGSAPSLPQLFSQLNYNAEPLVVPFIKRMNAALHSQTPIDFTHEWAQYIYTELTMLSERDLNIIAELGKTLGKYAINDELRELENTIQALNDEYVKTQADLQAKGKLYISCAASAATAVIIVLL